MNLETNSLAALNATSKASGKATLAQADFLRLMTTQLQTQDPLSPVDSQSMVAQMQQLSSTAGIAEMNASLKAIAAQIGGRSVDAATWIGHDALVASDFVNAGADGMYRGQVNLDKAADAVTIDLLDRNGLILNTQVFGGAGAGPVAFEWQGVGDAGTARGPLRVRVSARDANGTVATTTNVWTPVQAVQSPASGSAARLVTPNGLIAPEAVIRLG